MCAVNRLCEHIFQRRAIHNLLLVRHEHDFPTKYFIIEQHIPSIDHGMPHAVLKKLCLIVSMAWIELEHIPVVYSEFAKRPYADVPAPETEEE